MSLFVISAGHGLRDPGATNSRLGILEHTVAYTLCWHLRAALEAMGHGCEFVSCFQSLGAKIGAVNQIAAQGSVAAAVELHLNSAENPDAHGTEVLYFSEASKAMAAHLSETLSAAIDTKDRGAIRRTNLAWLTQTKPRAFIVELLFINNDREAMKIGPVFYQKGARAIAEGLTRYL